MEIIDSFTVFFERQVGVSSPITFPKKDRPPFLKDLIRVLGSAWRAYQKDQSQPAPFQMTADRAGVWVNFERNINFNAGADGLEIRLNEQVVKQTTLDWEMCHIYSPIYDVLTLYDEAGDLDITIALHPVTGEDKPLGFFVVNFGSYQTIARLVDGVKAKIQIITDEINFPCKPRYPKEF